MAEHEPSIGATSEWFTPPEYFKGSEPRPITAKTGLEPPRERQSNQLLVPNRPAAPLSFSNFSPNQYRDTRDRLAARSRASDFL